MGQSQGRVRPPGGQARLAPRPPPAEGRSRRLRGRRAQGEAAPLATWAAPPAPAARSRTSRGTGSGDGAGVTELRAPKSGGGGLRPGRPGRGRRRQGGRRQLAKQGRSGPEPGTAPASPQASVRARRGRRAQGRPSAEDSGTPGALAAPLARPAARAGAFAFAAFLGTHASPGPAGPRASRMPQDGAPGAPTPDPHPPPSRSTQPPAPAPRSVKPERPWPGPRLAQGRVLFPGTPRISEPQRPPDPGKPRLSPPVSLRSAGSPACSPYSGRQGRGSGTGPQRWPGRPLTTAGHPPGEAGHPSRYSPQEPDQAPPHAGPGIRAAGPEPTGASAPFYATCASRLVGWPNQV
ncbi:translation initiation factor IF-2-like [Talpa occidentalis]|uniref:translation initiation factor IF-2-like n=1 Tax=Talpa occidentalis TaxID=50954 RepID=UPI00188FFC17|nr:translation initiation factor IF-2-like [Talpa occidentalis]